MFGNLRNSMCQNSLSDTGLARLPPVSGQTAGTGAGTISHPARGTGRNRNQLLGRQVVLPKSRNNAVQLGPQDFCFLTGSLLFQPFENLLHAPHGPLPVVVPPEYLVPVVPRLLLRRRFQARGPFPALPLQYRPPHHRDRARSLNRNVRPPSGHPEELDHDVVADRQIFVRQ